MALPGAIDKSTPANTDSPEQGDDQFRALKTFIEDVFGIPDATSITAAAFSISSAGVVTVSQAGMVTKDIKPAQGTITADAPIFNATVTWNAAGVTFTAIKLNVTDTASAVSSLLEDLQVGGSSKWKVTKGGAGTLAGGLTSDGHLLWTTDNTYDIGASGTTRPRDLFLGRNATFSGTLSVSGAGVGIGGAAGTGNSIKLYGTTSGSVTISPAAAAGSASYTLPSADGTSGQALTTNGAGVLSFSAAGVALGDNPTWTGTHTWNQTGPRIQLTQTNSQIFLGTSTNPGWVNPTVVLRPGTTGGGMAIGAITTGPGFIVFNAYNNVVGDNFKYVTTNSATRVGFSAGEFVVLNAPSGTADTAITFVQELDITLGVVFGTPTGGNKGTGTANFAADIYKNNTAYTNPHGAFEMAYSGKLEKYASRMAAMGIKDYQHWTIDALETYTRKFYHFPYFEDEINNGLFGGGERHMLMTELLATYIFDQEKRLRALEKRPSI